MTEWRTEYFSVYRIADNMPCKIKLICSDCGKFAGSYQRDEPPEDITFLIQDMRKLEAPFRLDNDGFAILCPECKDADA